MMRVRLHAHIGSVRGPITRAVKQRPPSTHPCPSLARAPSHQRHTRRWCAYQYQDYTTGWQQRFDVHLDVTIWIAPDHVCMSVRATQANDGPSESGRVVAARVVLSMVISELKILIASKLRYPLCIPLCSAQRGCTVTIGTGVPCSNSARAFWTGEQQVL
jgi:hypothetical protein